MAWGSRSRRPVLRFLLVFRMGGLRRAAFVSATVPQSRAEWRQSLPFYCAPFDCAQGTGLRGLSEAEAFLLRVPCWAFGDPLLLRQKGAKPCVPAKLAGCCAFFRCRAGAAAVFFADAELARTVAGTFPCRKWCEGMKALKSKRIPNSKFIPTKEEKPVSA